MVTNHHEKSVAYLDNTEAWLVLVILKAIVCIQCTVKHMQFYYPEIIQM